MIFISYSHKDKDIVLPIYEKLKEKYGDKIFLDIERNGVGDKYWDNINIGLNTSTYFIFFNSYNYNNSAACGNEFCKALAKQEELKIIQIRLDDSPIHPSLTSRIYYNHEQIPDTIETIINSIEKASFVGFKKESLVEIKEIRKKEGIIEIRFKCLIDIALPTIACGVVGEEFEYPNFRINREGVISYKQTATTTLYEGEAKIKITKFMNTSFSKNDEIILSIENPMASKHYLMFHDPRLGIDNTNLSQYEIKVIK